MLTAREPKWCRYPSRVESRWRGPSRRVAAQALPHWPTSRSRARAPSTGLDGVPDYLPKPRRRLAPAATKGAPLFARRRAPTSAFFAPTRDAVSPRRRRRHTSDRLCRRPRTRPAKRNSPAAKLDRTCDRGSEHTGLWRSRNCSSRSRPCRRDRRSGRFVDRASLPGYRAASSRPRGRPPGIPSPPWPADRSGYSTSPASCSSTNRP